MKRFAVALVSLSLLAACGSDSKQSTATTLTPDGGSVPAAESGPVDPATTPGCSILTQEQMASVFGSAEGQWNPNEGRTDVAECQWSSSDGRIISFQIDLVNSPATMFQRVGDTVSVGNEAYSQPGAFPRLEADIAGWYVLIYGLEGVVTTDDTLALGQVLAGALLDRSQSTGGAPDGGDGGEAVAGTLTDMSVTIDSPANLAGTMTLADLEAQATSLALCGGPWTLNSVGKRFTVAYEFGVLSGGVTAPAPVVGLSLEVQGDYTGQGVYVATMRFATNTAEANGVGSMTVDAGELTGSFTYSDASGTITGSWMCAGS